MGAKFVLLARLAMRLSDINQPHEYPPTHRTMYYIVLRIVNLGEKGAETGSGQAPSSVARRFYFAESVVHLVYLLGFNLCKLYIRSGTWSKIPRNTGHLTGQRSNRDCLPVDDTSFIVL